MNSFKWRGRRALEIFLNSASRRNGSKSGSRLHQYLEVTRLIERGVQRAQRNQPRGRAVLRDYIQTIDPRYGLAILCALLSVVAVLTVVRSGNVLIPHDETTAADTKRTPEQEEDSP